jgi:predicted double-glycine peptidase
MPQALCETTLSSLTRNLVGIVLVAWGSATPQAILAETNRPVESLLEMRRENVVVQKWELSCGAAALATLLKYQHGEAVSETDIAKELIKREQYTADPSRLRAQQGFSLLDLKRFVNHRGFEGIGYGQLTLEALIDRAPAIVPIRTNGYNHFVVFRGVMGNRVLLADPAWGNRTMRTDQFESMWLDYPTVGKVGFVVVKRDGASSVNRLAPRAEEFLILR